MTDFSQHVGDRFGQAKKDFEQMNRQTNKFHCDLRHPTKEDMKMDGLKYNVEPAHIGPLQVYNLGQDPGVPGVNEYVLRLGVQPGQYLRLAFGLGENGKTTWTITPISDAGVGESINNIIESQI